MFRSGIDLRGKTHIVKVGLLASLALLRCQRSLNSLVKCTTSRLLVNCLWTHQKNTCLHINEAPGIWQGSSSHTYLCPWESCRFSWKPQNKGASHSQAGVSSHSSLATSSEVSSTTLEEDRRPETHSWADAHYSFDDARQTLQQCFGPYSTTGQLLLSWNITTSVISLYDISLLKNIFSDVLFEEYCNWNIPNNLALDLLHSLPWILFKSMYVSLINSIHIYEASL